MKSSVKSKSNDKIQKEADQVKEVQSGTAFGGSQSSSTFFNDDPPLNLALVRYDSRIDDYTVVYNKY